MEKGAKTLAIILLVSVVLGLVVIGLQADYHRSLLDLLQGQPEESPIWQSNLSYYPDITLSREPAQHAPD